MPTFTNFPSYEDISPSLACMRKHKKQNIAIQVQHSHKLLFMIKLLIYMRVYRQEHIIHELLIKNPCSNCCCLPTGMQHTNLGQLCSMSCVSTELCIVDMISIIAKFGFLFINPGEKNTPVIEWNTATIDTMYLKSFEF